MQLGHTACGIEPNTPENYDFSQKLQLGHTACGIETLASSESSHGSTVLQLGHTACGIETEYVQFVKQLNSSVATEPYRLRY